MSNSNGSYAVSVENDMKAYDKLPMLVRMAVANSVDNWAAPPILTMHRRGQPAHVIVGIIHSWNATERIDHWRRYDRLANNGTPYFAPLKGRKPKR